MILTLLFGLILGAISVVFITQNTMIVSVHFLGYAFQSSLALLIIVSILVGLLLAVLFFLPGVFSDYRSHRRLKKKNVELERTLADKEAATRTEVIQEKVIQTHLENRP